MGFINEVTTAPGHTCPVPNLEDWAPGTRWKCDLCGQHWAVIMTAALGERHRLREWRGTDEHGRQIGHWLLGTLLFAHHGQRAFVR